MKKTISIAALAISASASSLAFMGPPVNLVSKNYCLAVYTDESGGMIAGACDETANNAYKGLEIGENGCAENQISLTTSKRPRDAEFPIRIRACMPPNVAQL